MVVDVTNAPEYYAGCAEVWRALDACGIPEVPGVWNHESGPATRFTVVQIKQCYPKYIRDFSLGTANGVRFKNRISNHRPDQPC